jgi:hypothetical protein
MPSTGALDRWRHRRELDPGSETRRAWPLLWQPIFESKGVATLRHDGLPSSCWKRLLAGWLRRRLRAMSGLGPELSIRTGTSAFPLAAGARPSR